MRFVITLCAGTLLLSACTAPEIADWPPIPPPVPEDVVQRYVDIYASEEPNIPVYGPEDVRALSILSQRRARYATDDDDLDRLRREARATAAEVNDPSDKDLSPPARGRHDISVIERRVEREYDSPHDRRHTLRSKYGL